MTYERVAFDEWYVNGPEGVEQGFTVRERPAGRGPVRIVGSFGESLRVEYRADERAVDFLDPHGTRVLRYGALTVLDAPRYRRGWRWPGVSWRS